eukprot:GILJ01010716.1.p1 GENE.GILJ01010716.1~~GILJ01010716.1.p1  ORF type:complete len:422 (-),score=46.42 GILJ01010716.1:76-1317(-)
MDMSTAASPSAVSVSGPLSQADITGFCLCHEHVLLDMSSWHRKTAEQDRISLTIVESPIRLELLHAIRMHPWHNRHSLRLEPVDDAVGELRQFVSVGGQLVIDTTPKYLGRILAGLKRVSELSGTKIVVGTTPHVDPFSLGSVSLSAEQWNKDQLAREMECELLFGAADSEGVRSGIIGEIILPTMATNPQEQTMLRAASVVQSRTGAPLFITLPANHTEAMNILDIIEEEKGTLNKTVLLNTLADSSRIDYYIQLLERGVLLAFDTIGCESARYPMDEFPILSDDAILTVVARLTQSGFTSQILLSMNLTFRFMWTKFGGNGYAHLLRTFVPRLKTAGITDSQIDSILGANVKNLLLWWVPGPAVERTVMYFTCDSCKQEFEEEHQSYYKFRYRYCSMKCLQDHRKSGLQKP